MIYTIFHTLENQIYYIQQNIYFLLSSQLNNLKLSTLVLLFIGGNLTSLNPCLISILPIALSSVNKINNRDINKKTIIYGLLSSIILTIIAILLFNTYYYKIRIHTPILSSILIMIIGLNLLQILEFKLLPLQLFSINLKKIKENTGIADWIIGFTIGISSSSCSTPILATIIIWLSNSKNLLLGGLYIIFYLIGYILPIFIFISIKINYNKITKIINIWNYAIPTGGSLLLGIGFFSLLEHILI